MIELLNGHFGASPLLLIVILINEQSLNSTSVIYYEGRYRSYHPFFCASFVVCLSCARIFNEVEPFQTQNNFIVNTPIQIEM